MVYVKLPEIVAAGIYDSKVVTKNIAVSKKRKTSMFEIELPVCEGGISYIGAVSKPITPNMVICAKPGQERHTKFPYRCYYVHMIIHEGKLYDLLMNTPDIFETGKQDTYRELFQKITKHYNALADSEEIILQSLVLKLIYTISKEPAAACKHGTAGDNDRIIEQALQYIKAHLTEELNLECVAKAVSLSPIHFHNRFRTSVGKTLREYVEEQRLRKAINLLLTTNDSLTKIAYECGFSSQSYFSYVFKRKMHTTPREYVKEIYSRYEQ